MLRHCQFDDEIHECLFLRKGNPFRVETAGDDTMHLKAVFVFRTPDDITKAEKVLAVCRDMLAAWNDGPICGKCGCPLTFETAEGREDGLYCDKCITAIADAGPSTSTPTF
jgi:hypothetical protein